MWRFYFTLYYFELFAPNLQTTEFFGITRTRSIFEAGIERLSANEDAAPLAVKLCVRFVHVEQGLGETDRARAILQHASQFCNPKRELDFWMVVLNIVLMS